MRNEPDATSARPQVLGAVTWLGVIFLSGWLAWCAAFQFAGVTSEAEVISTHEERRRRKRGRDYYETYGVVRYADQKRQPHTDKYRLYAGEAVGSKIRVRYLPSRPDDGRRDDFWGIWGLSVMVSGVFALIIGLIWLDVLRRRRKASPGNPFRAPTEP
ncbi:MAG: hypothetical protein RLZZ178_511 [Verrucomicrobiota bacterium]|jgi:hypothetical protein